MKKENNNKNFGSHKAWMETKKVGRPKQVWAENRWIKLSPFECAACGKNGYFCNCEDQ